MSSRNSSPQLGSAKQEASGLFQELKAQGNLLVCIVVLLWAIELANSLMNDALNNLGIRPRNILGLQGIIFAPFLHGSWRHLISNTFPLVILSWLIMARDRSEWIAVTVLTAIASGLGTWLFGGAATIHIGASGVVFGYFGFLVARAYFERSLGSIAISLLVLALFGGMIWGILPVRVGISWEGHLFGLLGGIAAAWTIAALNRKVP
ncbi:MAG: rhomboid family intramembrane serine protease [Cyanobacteria bacterium]|nr:rhomboid family intramembrane serine protease [Cyanobacteriota bacterium]